MDMAQIDALIDSQSAPRTSVELCLRGDLQGRWEELERQLKEETSRGNGKLTGNTDEARRLADEIRAVEAEMKDSTVTFVLEGLGRSEWRELEMKHPARDDEPADQTYGFNLDSLFDDAIPASLVSPEIDRDRMAKILDKLTSAQFEQLAVSVLGLNRQVRDTPFSQTASLITQISDVTSKRP